MPSRSGSAIPSAMHRSTPDMMSPKSFPPLSPITAWAKACPRQVLPRGFGKSTAYPAAASRTAFGSESENTAFQHHAGPPCTSTSIGRGPAAPGGVSSRPSISRPSVEAQRMVWTSGNSTPSAISWLNEVRRTQVPLPGSNRASSGGTPCASWVVMTRAPPSETATCGLQTSAPMYASPAQSSSRSPPRQMLPQAVPVPSIRP